MFESTQKNRLTGINHQNDNIVYQPKFWLVGLISLSISIMLNMIGLVIPLYSMQVFDRVLPTASISSLLSLTLTALIFIGVSIVFDGIRNSILVRCAGRFDLSLTGLLRQDMTSKNAYSCQRDVETIRGFISGPVACSLIDLPCSVILFAGLFWISQVTGWLILVSSFLLLAIGYANYLLTKSSRGAAITAGTEEQRLASILSRDLHASAAMGTRYVFARQVHGLRQAVILHLRRAQGRSGWIEAVGRGLRQIVQVATVALAAVLVLKQAIGPGSILAMSMLSGRVLAPIERISGSIFVLYNVIHASMRLRKNLSLCHPNTKVQSLSSHSGMFALENIVVFTDSKNDRKVLLDKLSLRLSPGEILIVRGGSGTGKTMLCHLLAGLRPPSRGRVTLDGYDLNDLDREFFHSNIGYLCEVNRFAEDTVEGIIARHGIVNHDDVVQAAKLAGVHATILKLENGYKTMVGDKTTLCSGELRRIAIARAFYQYPRLIVLDDPTAHLDGDGEQDLAESLKRISSETMSTIVVVSRSEVIQAIAHREIWMRGAQPPHVKHLSTVRTSAVAVPRSVA